MPGKPEEQEQKKAGLTDESGTTTTSGKSLTEEEMQQVRELQSRDRQVRAHEAAHMSASGGLATGGASFTYQRGPDGENYAIGGEVHIDTSAVANDPEATIRKAEIIRRAALAPADPSSQDHQVAAAAMQMQAQASAELNSKISKHQSKAVDAYAQASHSGEASPDRIRLVA